MIEAVQADRREPACLRIQTQVGDVRKNLYLGSHKFGRGT
jgi:hypothetical protein